MGSMGAALKTIQEQLAVEPKVYQSQKKSNPQTKRKICPVMQTVISNQQKQQEWLPHPQCCQLPQRKNAQGMAQPPWLPRPHPRTPPQQLLGMVQIRTQDPPLQLSK